jgi:hypothetical protein
MEEMINQLKVIANQFPQYEAVFIIKDITTGETLVCNNTLTDNVNFQSSNENIVVTTEHFETERPEEIVEENQEEIIQGEL